MTLKSFLIIACLLLCSSTSYAQQQNAPVRLATDQAVENISRNMDRLTTSVETLTRGLKSFLDSYSSSQGFPLSTKQQTLLMAFEILNRAEQRLVNLQKMRLDIAERQSPMRLQLGQVNDDLLPQSVDRTSLHAAQPTPRNSKISVAKHRQGRKPRSPACSIQWKTTCRRSTTRSTIPRHLSKISGSAYFPKWKRNLGASNVLKTLTK